MIFYLDSGLDLLCSLKSEGQWLESFEVVDSAVPAIEEGVKMSQLLSKAFHLVYLILAFRNYQKLLPELFVLLLIYH